MSSAATIKKCLDCTEEMRPIHVIDHSHGGVQGQLAYSTTEKTKSWFSSYYREEGRLIAFMCEKCGSVRFFGEPIDPDKRPLLSRPIF